jgi:hypothetical protein
MNMFGVPKYTVNNLNTDKEFVTHSSSDLYITQTSLMNLLKSYKYYIVQSIHGIQ